MKSPSTLQIALGVSIAFHVVLLTVRFVDPERFNRVFQDTPLEVILVNAKSNEKPDFAKAIAQASLADPNWVGMNMEAYVFAGSIYWLLCFALSRWSRSLERRR